MLRNRTLGGLLVLGLLVGCTGKKSEEFKSQEAGKTVKAPEVHEHGPNNGHLADLGTDHKLMVEITYAKDPRAITIFVLDHNDTSKYVAVAAEEMNLDLHDENEKAHPVKLTAEPRDGEGDGKSSRFVVKGDDIPEFITGLEVIEGDLKVTVGEETLEAEFGEHDHDEDEDHKDEKKD